jgi:hypothetical protein
MATTAQDAGIVTLHELVKAQHDGKLLRIAEVLQKKTPLYRDLHWEKGNHTTGHMIRRRRALASGSWRGLNEGVEPTKSKTETLTEECGLFEARSEVDAVFMQLNGGDEYRAKEDMAVLSQVFPQEAETGFIYHSKKTAPKKFTGLIPRLDALSGLPVGQSQVVASQISASGDDQMSALLVGHGPGKVYAITPQNCPTGIQHVDMGPQDLTDVNGNKYEGRVSIFRQWMGLCVEDYRYVVRVCNLDKSAMVRTGKLIIQSLIDGYHQLQDPSDCNPVWYMGRYLARFLHQQIVDCAIGASIAQMDIEDGRPVMRFMSVPVRITESMHTAEAIVA